MHPDKVRRDRLHTLTDLPNIGPAGAADLQLLGIRHPEDLIGCCPYDLFEKLFRLSGSSHDPCVLDVFMSVIAFMHGASAQPWWTFTPIRKKGPRTWAAHPASGPTKPRSRQA